MAAAPAATATRSTKTQEREARAERTRRDGRRRTTATTTKNLTPVKTPVEAPKPAPKPRAAAKPRAKKIVVVTDTKEAQAARALANLKEAEARRPQNVPAVRSTTTVEPTKATTRRTTADLDQHEFDLDKALEKLDERFLQCRDFGHSWRPFSANWSEQYQSYSSQLRCDRCTTVRTRWLTRTGAMMGGGYDYSEGYLVKGMGRLTGSDRDKVRLRSILNVLKPTAAND